MLQSNCRNSRKNRSRVLSCMAMGLCLLLLSTTGCGPSDGLYEATGNITLDGEPLEGAFVTLHPKSPEGSVSYAQTDKNGDCVVEFSDTKDGILPGEYFVNVQTAGEDLEGGIIKERVPSRYQHTEDSESELSFTVSADSKNHFEFKLTSEGPVVQPTE